MEDLQQQLVDCRARRQLVKDEKAAVAKLKEEADAGLAELEKARGLFAQVEAKTAAAVKAHGDRAAALDVQTKLYLTAKNDFFTALDGTLAV
jgi:hypothetical protein